MPVKHVFHPMTIHLSERATSFQTVVLGLVTLIDLRIFETTWCNLVRRWPNKFMTLWLRSTKIWSLTSWVTQNLDHGIILFNFYGWIAPSWYHFKSKKTSIRHVFPTVSGSKDKKLVQWNQEKDGKQLVAACLRTGYIFEKQVTFTHRCDHINQI